MPLDTTESNAVRDTFEEISQYQECNGEIIYTADQAKTVCGGCGLVIGTESIDREPEWRAFTPTERGEWSRVGVPMTELLPDNGLSTTISWRDSAASGQSMPPRQRKPMHQLRTWDERSRPKNALERISTQALGEIRPHGERSWIAIPRPSARG